ncbi:MAG: hypothetical protein HQL65_07285 [Magnetococcales bacterium]|nr:hypothetical protein [Magnetococcales bacterium]
MVITRIEHINEADLLKRFAKTRLCGYGQPLIYEHARLELVRQIDPRNLFPAQKYVLREDFERLHALHNGFMAQGVDIFNLEGGLFFWMKNPEIHNCEDGPIPLTPPMVEMSHEPDGRTIPLINDGMHRIYVAMRLRKRINVVLAHDVPLDYPYYAYALEKGWDEVLELNELPEGFVKKEYRDPKQYKALFRDFNAIFDGIQKQRKQTNPIILKA